MPKVLIVEDVYEFSQMLNNAFSSKGYVVSIAKKEDEAIKKLKEEYDLVILDLALGGTYKQNESDFEGLRILEIIQEEYPLTMVIVMSVHREERLNSLEKGAYDFIEKASRSESIRGEILIKANKALQFRSIIKRRMEESKKLDNNGYLIIDTDKLLDKFRNEEFISYDLDRIKSIDDDYKKFKTLTGKISEEYIGSIEDIGGPLHTLVLLSSELDVLLYLTRKRYRDHYKHQFLVGALGWFLLDIELPGGKTLREEIEDKSQLSSEQINQAWWTAALLHDHGYPLSYILRSVREINRVKGEISYGKGIIDKIRSLYDSYDKVFSHELLSMIQIDKLSLMQSKVQRLLLAFIPKEHVNLLAKIENEFIFDHGVIGAINLVSYLDESGCSIDDNSWIKESLIAICFHNSLHLTPDISFREHPIAFLLRLCDELQEWDRKTFNKNNLESKLEIETDHIKLGHFTYDYKRKRYRLLENKCLSVLFEYLDPNVLKRTDWDLGCFENSKRKNLSALKIDGTFINEITFVISKLNKLSM